MSKVVVIGDGGWGTALALVLARKGHAVTVWGAFADYIEQIRAGRTNPRFLPGVELPPEIDFTADRSAAASADAVVIAAPSRYFADVVSSFASHIRRHTPVVSVTKGLDQRTGHRMTELAEELLGRRAVAALSGPSHAEEVARGIPSAVVIGCTDPAIATLFQELFISPAFRVYTSDDVIGVEFGGALKNVIAIAAGVCDGIGFGDNSKAALMTRGLAEISRLGCALGAHPATFAGLSGMGDLVVTCTSRHSRNRGVGERLGRGETWEQIQRGMVQVAEGVWTSGTARMLARERKVDVPITEAVYAVIYEGKSPHKAVEELLTREAKPERG